jgi:murein DD-endopeptidase MepM/ murein hydrolase activator NlpD
VTQGHRCRTNHRIGGPEGAYGGDYAWDFAAIDRRGRLAGEVFEITRRNQDTAAFGQPVLAPAAGVVIHVVRDLPDNEGLTDYPRRSLLDDREHPAWSFGNHVVVDMGDGAFVLLAHLQRDSIGVAPGQRVGVGDVLGRCGNSGNSFVPHLHLQVMDRADVLDPQVLALPAEFVDYVEFTAIQEGDRREVVTRQVASGDPPEGRLLYAAPAPR